MPNLPDFLNCTPLGPTTITNNTRLSIHVCYLFEFKCSNLLLGGGEGYPDFK